MEDNSDQSLKDPSKRDFMVVTASGVAAVGAACAVWPLADSLNPSADVLALSSIEVDLANVHPGQTVTVKWRGKPVFIRHRTKDEIEEAENVPLEQLADPQTDSERVKKAMSNGLLQLGFALILDAFLWITKVISADGFVHAMAHTMTLQEELEKGPAPLNLEVPNYEFVSDTKIKIG